MPLGTQIRRKGRALKVRWSQFHVAAMVYAAALDSKEGKLYEAMVAHDEVPTPEELKEGFSIPPGAVFHIVSYPVIAATPLNSGDYTLQGSFRFVDPTDGEVFDLLPGDVLSVWR